jgi:hypothetical protein
MSVRRGTTVVLLMGEVATGKTTLLCELWTRFLLAGHIGDLCLAGSRTALAFEERSYLSRMRSQAAQPDTARSQVESDGFLHIRAKRDDNEPVELLLSDVSGEHFERVREGTALVDELPWVARVDRFAVFVDGQALVCDLHSEVVRQVRERVPYAADSEVDLLRALEVGSLQGQIFTADAVARTVGLPDREVLVDTLDAAFVEDGQGPSVIADHGHHEVRLGGDVRHYRLYRFTSVALWLGLRTRGLEPLRRSQYARNLATALFDLYGSHTALIASSLVLPY